MAQVSSQHGEGRGAREEAGLMGGVVAGGLGRQTRNPAHVIFGGQTSMPLSLRPFSPCCFLMVLMYVCIYNILISKAISGGFIV